LDFAALDRVVLTGIDGFDFDFDFFTMDGAFGDPERKIFNPETT